MAFHTRSHRERRARFASVAPAATLATAAAAAVIACGSSSSGSGPGRGDAFCSTFSDYARQCGKTDPCTDLRVQNCPSFESNVSAAYVSATIACAMPPYKCDGGAATSPSCLLSQLVASTPTAAQAKVKADFCAQCPDGKSQAMPRSCSNFFLAPPPGAGLYVQFGNDAIAAQMDKQCTGASASTDGGAVTDCALRFFGCSMSVFAMHTASGSCSGGVGGMSFPALLLPEN